MQDFKDKDLCQFFLKCCLRLYFFLCCPSTYGYATLSQGPATSASVMQRLALRCVNLPASTGPRWRVGGGPIFAIPASRAHSRIRRSAGRLSVRRQVTQDPAPAAASARVDAANESLWTRAYLAPRRPVCLENENEKRRGGQVHDGPPPRFLLPWSP